MFDIFNSLKVDTFLWPIAQLMQSFRQRTSMEISSLATHISQCVLAFCLRHCKLQNTLAQSSLLHFLLVKFYQFEVLKVMCDLKICISVGDLKSGTTLDMAEQHQLTGPFKSWDQPRFLLTSSLLVSDFKSSTTLQIGHHTYFSSTISYQYDQD